MSIIPEILIQRTIIQGLNAVRKDSRLIDTIFKNLNQSDLASLKNFFLKTTFGFYTNYPQETIKAPCFILLLKEERESEAFMGDMLGDSADPYVPDPELTIDTLGGHAASTSPSTGLPRKVLGPLNVNAQTGPSTIEFDADATEFVEDLIRNPVGSLNLHVVSGAGAGKVYSILRIRNDGLDIIDTFELNLDDSSVIDIRVPEDPEMAVGEPSRLYSIDNKRIVRKGVNYQATYNLHVVAASQDQVIYLYALLKALLLSQRVYLESQGLQSLIMSGSDLALRSEYLPTELFQRIMTVTFTYPYTFIDEQDVFTQLAIDIVPEPVDDPMSSVLIGTTIDLSGD